MPNTYSPERDRLCADVRAWQTSAAAFHGGYGRDESDTAASDLMDRLLDRIEELEEAS